MTEPLRLTGTDMHLCPGACQRPFLAAGDRAARALEREHRTGVAADPAVVDHDVRPVAGQPVWCRPCAERISLAIGLLPDRAAALTAMTGARAQFANLDAVRHQYDRGRLTAVLECGHTVGSDFPTNTYSCARCLAGASTGAGKIAATGQSEATRKATRAGSPSGSPAWDTVDELIAWTGDLEDRLRATLGHAPAGRDHWAGGHQARVRTLTGAVTYLTTWSTALLSSRFAVQAGRDALRLERRAERAAGEDRLVHRLPAPCPSCDRLALTRDDGDDVVACQACGRSWPEADYRRLTLVLASDVDGRGVG